MNPWSIFFIVAAVAALAAALNWFSKRGNPTAVPEPDDERAHPQDSGGGPAPEKPK